MCVFTSLSGNGNFVNTNTLTSVQNLCSESEHSIVEKKANVEIIAGNENNSRALYYVSYVVGQWVSLKQAL